VRIARRRVPELAALICGDGPQRGAVQAAIGGDPAIQLLGFRTDVPRLLRASDMLVLASEHEALPMAVLEGMAAGLPVLATRVGGIPDLVGEGECGLLVAPRDVAGLSEGLVRLATDAQLRDTMGAQARRRVRAGFSAEAMIDSYERLVRAWASGKPR